MAATSFRFAVVSGEKFELANSMYRFVGSPEAFIVLQVYHSAGPRLTLSVIQLPKTQEIEARKEAQGHSERRKKDARERSLGRAAVLSAPIDYDQGKSGGLGTLKRSGKKITLCTPYVIRARLRSSAHA
ncbi:hypothetical protein ANTQUA_LOCUS2789 [Anthophora quadrimaculata]